MASGTSAPHDDGYTEETEATKRQVERRKYCAAVDPLIEAETTERYDFHKLLAHRLQKILRMCVDTPHALNLAGKTKQDMHSKMIMS